MKKTHPPPDPKLSALRQSGTLHPHPQHVTDPLFAQHDFFDARDTLQVKYEMLRRVHIDAQPISRAASAFGCSRPAFYQAQSAFKAQGLAGLLPRKRGPHQAHKLTEEILAFVEHARASQTPSPSTLKILQQIRQQFQLVVHRRSLERALVRRKKNSSDPPIVPHLPVEAAADLAGSYETLRAQVLGTLAAGGASGWTLLVRRGLAAWLGTVPAAESVDSPRLNPTPPPVPPDLRHQVANVLVTMVWNHYQNQPL